MLLSFLVALAAPPALALSSLTHQGQNLAARQGEWLITTANALNQPALTANADLKLVHMPNCNLTAPGDDTAYPVITHIPSGTTFWGECFAINVIWGF